jgi:hypothetical protein
MKIKTIIWIVIVVAVAVALVVWLNKIPARAGELDTFATCIKDSGATFYGAFWCPHCQNQKAMFGSSAKLLPYVECSTPDGRGQLAVCKDAGVTGYPTWTFLNASTTSGEVSLEDLSELTNCPLPTQAELPQTNG